MAQGLEEHSKLIKSCGSLKRRTKEGRGKIETWKLSLMSIITTVHHARKPKAKKPTSRPPELFLYHLGRTRENLTKMLESHNLDEETREEIRRQIDSMKTGV